MLSSSFRNPRDPGKDDRTNGLLACLVTQEVGDISKNLACFIEHDLSPLHQAELRVIERSSGTTANTGEARCFSRMSGV